MVDNEYEKKFVDGPGFNKIGDKQLRAQLVDFGAASGPAIAINKLQDILKMKPNGVLDSETLVMLSRIHAEDVNNLLVAARVKMIGAIVVKNPAQLKYLGEWLDRALQFLI